MRRAVFLLLFAMVKNQNVIVFIHIHTYIYIYAVYVVEMVTNLGMHELENSSNRWYACPPVHVTGVV